jgi:L-2-hydroxyglutarate oxidase LhgO
MTGSTCAVIGGGIVGAAVAHRLGEIGAFEQITLLEKEPELARHQTGRNSGVVHAGLYYAPGSLKARLCRRGVGMLREFCTEHGVAYSEIGKVLVALDEVEAGRLGAIEERALANGVPRVRRLGPDELRELEPHVVGVAGLHSPTTAIADFPGVTRVLGSLVEKAGGQVKLSTTVVDLRETPGGVEVSTSGPSGRAVEVYDQVVICAGLHVDRLARKVGGSVTPRITPFRGEYYALVPSRRDLVRGLVYPVPDPRYPFLGVHLTPRVDGEVLIGPNAVLALAREGYTWRRVSGRDLAQAVGNRGFGRFAMANWRTGVSEMAGSLSKRRFIAAAQRYVPELTVDDVVRGPAGVRAQSMETDGTLVDDFRIERHGRVTALRNAPSPAATSSLAIAEHLVAEMSAHRAGPS